jgi:probable F420-dependent oxidoreductase
VTQRARSVELTIGVEPQGNPRVQGWWHHYDSPTRSQMKFSLSLPVFHEPGARDPYAPMFELASLAERGGFDTLTLSHHHFMAGWPSDPLLLLGAVAARTERIRVGTNIFLLSIDHPLQVAERVATLDQLSGGRVTLGVGSGWGELQYTAFATSSRHRGARMDEALEILRRVWTETDVAHHGRFHPFPPLTVEPRPVQQPHPPLWVAGVADAAIDRAARFGDAWLCGPVQSLRKVRECLATYRAACARHGTEPRWVLRRSAWIGTDRRELVDEFLPHFVESHFEHWRESAEDDAERELFARLDGGEQVPAADIVADRFIGGTPSEVIAEVHRYVTETGCDHLGVSFGVGSQDRPLDNAARPERDALARMIELFGREVIPAFAGA